ncbi:MAG: protein kinase [Chthoniobacteraceae bacterium]
MSSDDAPTISDFQFEVTLSATGPGALVFGRYRLERELGRGGMGVVWLAHDEKVDLPVALKFLPDIVARDSEAVDELKRELRRGLSLTHPGIVRVYSFEQDDTGAAIVMEYVDGPTLSSLKLKQPLTCFDAEDLLPMIEQLCVALDYAHFEAKIVHRDLKPRNLMLTSKGRLKIADFGVATSISDTVSRVSLRKDGSGTPPYMSPQQAFGENPSPGDDIYSLGATLYELLTGRPPFYQGNILAQVQQRVPPAMSERREVLKVAGKKPIPPEWEATISSCLAKLADDRPQRAGELIEMLRGQRPPPHGGHTDVVPINPALSPPVSREALPRAKAVPAPETAADPGAEDDEATTRAAPARRGKVGAGLVLGLLLAAVGGVWWWQQQQIEKAHSDLREVQAQVPAAPTPGVAPAPVATPIPAGGKPMRTADEEAAEAGRIPKASAPWENSLAMKFVPVPGIAALVSIFETRVEDYRAFAVETRRPQTPTEFVQGGDHPVVNVTWFDAVSFCEWLTRKERAAGVLGSTQRYRLLTDAEWSRTAGIVKELGATPAENDRKITEIFPWGTASVPPNGTENLAGEGETVLTEKELIGYRDGFSHTAPAGRFPAIASGLHDIGGNVSEWVEEWFDSTESERTTRGAAFIYISDHDRCSTFRWHLAPGEMADYIGFRVALDAGK